MMKFRELKAEEIDVRVGGVYEKGITMLLYKDARVDMAILDEAVGPAHWQRDHKEVKGNLYCGIGIRSCIVDNEITATDEWVWKWDCGAESYTEKEKGEASDSFKRAGFNWGIGRELYTSPFVWVNAETKVKDPKALYKTYELTKAGKDYVKGAYVSDIGYKDRKITTLVISNANGEVLFSHGSDIKPHKQKNTSAEVTTGGVDFLENLAKEAGVTRAQILLEYNVEFLNELTTQQYTDCVKRLEKLIGVKE